MDQPLDGAFFIMTRFEAFPLTPPEIDEITAYTASSMAASAIWFSFTIHATGARARLSGRPLPKKFRT